MSTRTSVPADTAPIQTVQRPLWRRILRIAGRVFGGLVLLIVLALGFLHTPWGKKVVRGRVEHALQKKVNGKVKLTSLDYGFMFGSLSLGGLEIRDANDQPAISIASIDIDLDRGALLDKELVMDELAVRGLAVNLVKKADGTSNLTGLFKKSKDKPSLSRVKIAKLSVTGAAHITKPDGKEVAIDDLSIEGAVEARPAAQELDVAIAKIGAKLDITAPKQPERHLEVAIEGITAKRRATALDVEVAKVGAGVVAIDAIGAHLKLENGKPTGDQKITIGKVRVDSKQVATLAGRQVLLDDVALDLDVTGPASALVVNGKLATRDTSLVVKGTADIAGAVPRYNVSLIGKGRSSDVVVPKPGKRVPSIETDIQIDIAGSGITKSDMDAQVTLAVGPTKIDNIAVDGVTAKATAKQGAYHLESFAAHGVAFDITASGDLAADKSLTAKLNVDGSPQKALKILGDAGIVIPRKVPGMNAIVPAKLALAVTASGRIDGELNIEVAPTKIPLAGGTIAIEGTAKLEKKKLQIAHTKIALTRLDLESLARIAGKPAKAKGTLTAKLDITKTPTTRDATFDLNLALKDKPITVIATGTANLTSASARAEVRGQNGVLATLAAKLPLDAKGFQPAGAWNVTVDAKNDLAQIAALLPEEKRAKIPAGDVAIHAQLGGSPMKPTGTISIDATAAAIKNIAAREHVVLTATLAPSNGHLAVALAGNVSATGALEGDLAKIQGTIAMPFQWRAGKIDKVALRSGLVVDATIDLPERPLASLSNIRAKLAEFGGTIGGRIAVKGPAKTPALDVKLAWRGYQTAAGKTGETTIAATGTPNVIAATIEHDGLKILADIDRTNPKRITIASKMRADKAPLLDLLPAQFAAKLAAAQPGSLDWNMDANLVLADGKLDQAQVTGTLDVKGASIKIPKSHRVYHDVSLSVAGEPAGIRIKSLEAHESDMENKDRKLQISGLVALDKMKAKHVDLTLAARDWLVFGTDKLGMPDAPRATATFDIGVAVDLSQPIIGVDATISSLQLRSPDRQERGHGPEKASVAGDIIFVDSKLGVTGKLPVDASIAKQEKKRKPMDVRIHIPKPIHVEQTPLDVMADGELTVKVRDEGIETRGVLKVESGKLNLFGHDHKLIDGSLTFSDEHPHGWMALTFERDLPDFAKRELSSRAGGARITMTGSPSTPKVALSGSANAAMFEVMAMYNAGRPLNISSPGKPASATVQAPRGDQLFMLTFMASNLPHLLFLDRASAWADPSPATYGQISNFEGETYTANQKSRVRAVVRPTTPGRSNAELQYDRMLINNDRAAFGVGVRAGDRLGGGLGFFFEWSSKD